MDKNSPTSLDERAAQEAKARAAEQQVVADTVVALARDNERKAQERDLAWNVAAVETDERQIAEERAAQAKIAETVARREADTLKTEHAILRSNLATEREAASQASFGFIFMVCIALAVLLGLGVWYYLSSDEASKQANANTQALERAALRPARPAPRPVTINVNNPPPLRESPKTIVVPVPSKSQAETAPPAPPADNVTETVDPAASAANGEETNKETTPGETSPSTGSESDTPQRGE